MDTTKTPEAIDQDRRRLLGTAAMGIAAAGAASLLPSQLAAAPAGDAIRPFRVNIPEAALADLRRRIAATRWPEQGNRHRCIAGRAAHDDPAARALLGDRLRLAQGRGAAQRRAELHHRDRRAGHPLHPCPLEA